MEFPKRLEGTIFTEVIPQMIPEVDFDRLLILGTAAKRKGDTACYDPLKAALRKIQWVKFVGLKAIAIEQNIMEQAEPETILMDPVGQIEHSLSVTDCLIHTKSALDSMAIFLTELLKLDAKGSKRDLKRKDFRRQVMKDIVIGPVVERLERWLAYLQEVRDEWIHRSSIRSFIVSGPSDVGFLPIPKKPSLVGKLPPKQMSISSENFWSTRDFVVLQYLNLVSLFKAIVERSIQILERELNVLPVPDVAERRMANKASFFPTRVTKSMTVKKMRVSNIDLSAYYKRIGEAFGRLRGRKP